MKHGLGKWTGELPGSKACSQQPELLQASHWCCAPGIDTGASPFDIFDNDLDDESLYHQQVCS